LSGGSITKEVLEFDTDSKVEMSTLFLTVLLSLPLSVWAFQPFGNFINSNTLDTRAREQLEFLKNGDYRILYNKDNGIEEVSALSDDDVYELKIPQDSMFLGLVSNSKPLNEATLKDLKITAKRRNRDLNPYIFSIYLIKAKENARVTNASVRFASPRTTGPNDLVIVAKLLNFEEFIAMSPEIDAIVAVDFDEADSLRKEYSDFFELISNVVGTRRKLIVGAAIPANGQTISKEQAQAVEHYYASGKNNININTDYVITDKKIGAIPAGSVIITANTTGGGQIGFQR